MHLKASLFDHHNLLHHTTSVFVPFFFSYFCEVNISYNQVTDGCGSAAVLGKIMRRTEDSNKVVVFVGQSIFV